MKTTIRVISAPIFITSLAFIMNACGQGPTTTPIQAAKPTEQGRKLMACADKMLKVEAKTFGGTEAKVCRVRDGVVTDEVIPLLFGGVKREKRVGIYQTVVFKITERDANGEIIQVSEDASEEAIERDRSMLEGSVKAFLRDTCRPIAKKVFTRSEVEADVVFRGKTKDDRWAQPNPSEESAKPKSTLSDEPFGRSGITQIPEAARLTPTSVTDSGKKVAPKPIEASRPVYSSASEFHSVLKLDVIVDGKNRQIRIADEVDAVVSGIAVLEKPTEDQLRFCNQLILRVGESFGLTKGRDCASRAEAAAKQKAAATSKDAAKDSTKISDKGAIGLEAPKISQEEILEVLKPVCGSI